MIISKTIIINKPTGKYFKYYKNLGYDVSKEKIEIDINHLSLGSKYKIEVKCNYCGVVKKIDYNSYNKSTNKRNLPYCCKKCGSIKHKEIFLENNGVENPFQLDSVKEKIKETCLEKYGVDSFTKTDEYIEKSKKTSLENWGVENPSQSEEIKEKKKETLKKNYGVESPLKSEEIKNKLKKTNLDKYGVEYIFQNINIRENIKRKNLEKFGVEYHTMTEKWKSKMKSVYFDKYGSHPTKNETFREENHKLANDVNYIKYIGNSISLFKCDRDKEHEFEILYDNYKSRKLNKSPLCTVCNPIGDSQSIKEKEFYNFINSIYNGDIIQSYRDGLEIDVYLPDLNLGFEFNGLYWHSEECKDKFYHINKTKHFKERVIRIIHIWEDDWDNKRPILESQIKNWLGLTPNKVFARKCEVIEIEDSKIVSKFLEENHIQGRVGSNLKLGLYYNDELVSLMTFDHYEGRNKMNKNEWNINRFCNKLNHNIIGGASKLFKHFIKNYEVKRVISYSDSDWSLGFLYEKLGFEKINEGNPDYKYILNGSRIHKSKFRKSRLDTNLSESVYMKKSQIYKIWDCGKIKFEKKCL